MLGFTTTNLKFNTVNRYVALHEVINANNWVLTCDLHIKYDF